MNIFSIKIKLIIISALVILSAITSIIFFKYSLSDIEELENIQYYISNVKTDMLTLRRNEKDFLMRHNLKYREKFNKNFEKLLYDLKSANNLLSKLDLNRKSINNLLDYFNKYHELFNQMVSKQIEVGINSKSGLYGSLRESIHKAEDEIKKQNNIKLEVAMLTLRRNEKDFMLRRLEKYVDKYNKNYTKAISLIENTQILHLFELYKKDFINLVNAERLKGLSHKSGLQGELREVIHKTESILKKELKYTHS